MRSVWAELVGDRGLLQRAYSLDGVAEELPYIVGPLMIGAGTLAFVTSRHWAAYAFRQAPGGDCGFPESAGCSARSSWPPVGGSR